MNYNEFISKAVCNYDLAGLVVSVCSESSVDAYYASGYSDVATKEPMTDDKVFHMASVSKLFTSTALLKLYEEGKFDLQDKLVEILPWFDMDDPRVREITVKHLLTHTAGMPGVDDLGWETPNFERGALKDFALSAKGLKLQFAPSDNKFNYSDMTYDILGSVIEELSGQTYDEFIDNSIFRPLGMEDSTFLTYRRAESKLDLDGLMRANVCMPHTKDKNNHLVRLKYFPYTREHGPSSTLTCTHRDLHKFGRAHLHKTLLNEESYKMAWEGYTAVSAKEDMGLSWFIRRQSGYTLYGHEGADDGFRSSFWICPELGIQIVSTSNTSKAPVKKITMQIFDSLI